MTHCGIPFAEECIRVRQPESKAAILRHSPSGKVPALKMKGLVVCDSLAVLEFLAERHPEHQLWQSDPEARAIARSIAAGASGTSALTRGASTSMCWRMS